MIRHSALVVGLLAAPLLVTPAFAQAQTPYQQQHQQEELANCLAKHGQGYPVGYCDTPTPTPTLVPRPTATPVPAVSATAATLESSGEPAQEPAAAAPVPCWLTDPDLGDPDSGYVVFVDDGSGQFVPVPCDAAWMLTPDPTPSPPPPPPLPATPTPTPLPPVRAAAPLPAPPQVIYVQQPAPPPPTAEVVYLVATPPPPSPTSTSTRTATPTRVPTGTAVPTQTAVPTRSQPPLIGDADLRGLLAWTAPRPVLVEEPPPHHEPVKPIPPPMLLSFGLQAGVRRRVQEVTPPWSPRS